MNKSIRNRYADLVQNFKGFILCAVWNLVGFIWGLLMFDSKQIYITDFQNIDILALFQYNNTEKVISLLFQQNKIIHRADSTKVSTKRESQNSGLIILKYKSLDSNILESNYLEFIKYKTLLSIILNPKNQKCKIPESQRNII
ncbi:hypothetical protein CQA53_04945 [Helicobacter didelphidarum]|uniref:Uncharacterized protein n=1 Tax=Helicobacter didelphidarum TaxID=2040648 RepID=A0A3D8IN17_9HELI|nr:hypothetical protein [Helicobacter didelphidarum]RDU65971.1 hypothetical protein CQA53_04945 [Helicobacter didelphidarum]